MYMIKRSPILKLIAAVAVNAGFLLVCQQYWRTTENHLGNSVNGGSGVSSPEQILVLHHRHHLQQYPLNQQYAAVNETPLFSFEVPEELYLTHDVTIPYDIPAWTAVDSASLRTAAGYDIMSDLLKPEYQFGEEVTDKNQLDWARTARAQRIYKSLWKFLLPVFESLPGDSPAEKERAIRRLQPELLIQLFHMGAGDLSEEKQRYVREMATNIEVVDITQLLDNDYMKLGGWSIKAFSMLASRFEEVILVDSDAYFLQDPALLFEDPGCKATGGLFFYDRTLFLDWRSGPNWLHSMMPIMSSLPTQIRTFKGTSTHEQESGVVVINKKTRLNGLLAICKMNLKYGRDLWSYKIFYGDKETFWDGMEMAQEPYTGIARLEANLNDQTRSEQDKHFDREEIRMHRKRPVLEKDKRAICGAQLHLDHLGQPMWWNGGLMRNKNEGVQRTLEFKYWMVAGGMTPHKESNVRNKELVRELLWDLGKVSMEEIEKDAVTRSGVQVLGEREKRLAESFVKMDYVGKTDEGHIKAGEKVDPKLHDWASM
ncbi:hypothetical protein BGX29_006067 [Mortierella sp. GBA35]|nr:hypothetical protein BGX29_006067 [Mortierella sp. GBA35]